MKKTITFIVAAMALLIVSIGATAFNVTMTTNTSIIAAPPGVSLSLYDFSTIYHMNGNPAGRNPAYPVYEYQFEGERVHFNAFISSNAMGAAEHANVTVVMQCPQGNFSQHLTLVGSSNLIGGVYVAPYQADYVIPSPLVATGNCPIVVRIAYLTSSGFDDLSLLRYQNINDLLMNPSITLTGSSRSYPSTTLNNYNNANPYPVTITMSSSAVDREGQGVIGNLTQYVSYLCESGGFCINPGYQRMSFTGGPSDWRFPDSTTGKLYLKEMALTTTPSSFSEYWQLYFETTFPINSYVSNQSESFLYEIY